MGGWAGRRSKDRASTVRTSGLPVTACHAGHLEPNVYLGRKWQSRSMDLQQGMVSPCFRELYCPRL